MDCLSLSRGALAAFLCALPVVAQTISLPGGVIVSPPIAVQQSSTTGMVGLTTNQTARLNVLNLNAVSSTATLNPSANCTVELQFLDNNGAIVKQATVSNVAPGTATSLDLPRASVTSETAARAEIRGVVVVNPAPTPVGSPAAVGYCSVMTTLEIYDATTGSTVSLTSDTRSVGLSIVLPLASNTGN